MQAVMPAWAQLLARSVVRLIQKDEIDKRFCLQPIMTVNDSYRGNDAVKNSNIGVSNSETVDIISLGKVIFE